jgi:hypothetical protein
MRVRKSQTVTVGVAFSTSRADSVRMRGICRPKESGVPSLASFPPAHMRDHDEGGVPLETFANTGVSRQRPSLSSGNQ